MQIVGFDPGGQNAFGWAILESSQHSLRLVASGECTGAPTALAQASEAMKGEPAAIGIDAPLFWTYSGDRHADQVVRKLVCNAGGQSGTVSHVNSLRGACLVQGILIANLARAVWPGTKITEAHPKALLRVCASANVLVNSLQLMTLRDHERDAVIAAYSAYEMLHPSADWHDLVPKEVDPVFPAGNDIVYWFPKNRT